MGSTYDTACAAADKHRDTRTPAQRRWDERAYAVSEYAAKLRALTCPDRMSWARNSKILEAVSDIVSDMERELKALRIEGYREGDLVSGIPAVPQITIKCATFEQVQPKQAAE